MANLTPTPGWDEVFQLETDTPVLGGAGGVANSQAQALLNRTSFLEGATGSSKIGYTPAGTGAVPTTVEDKLRERVSVFGFMTEAEKADVRSGLATVDVTDAIQAALAHAYTLATATPRADGWRRNTPEIELPRGRFRIAQPNKLFQTLTFYNGKITGAGKRGGTELVYDVPAATATDYLIKNDNLFGFVQFHGIRFFCANQVANQNFMFYSSSGSGQNFSFTECEWDGFSLNFNVQGNANVSENTFTNCTFVKFSDAAFRMNNQQAVNWRFYGCDAENFSGTLFEMLKGFNFIWSGGSIIPTANTGRIIKVPAGADANSFGSSNSPNALFQCCRFEMRNGSLMAEKLNSAANVVLNYDGCGMGGINIPDPSLQKMFTWVGAGEINLANCENLNNYRFSHSVSGAGTSELAVSFDTCNLPTDVITGSTFTISPSSNNGGIGPIFDIRNCGSRVDGVYRIFDSQYMNNSLFNRKGISKTKRGISFDASNRNLAVVPSGTSFDVYIPPTRVIKAELFPIANAGYGTINGTITITNAAGTVTLATLTYIMGPSAPVIVEQNCNYFVDAMNGDYLKVIFSHDTTPTTNLVFSGQLYLTY